MEISVNDKTLVWITHSFRLDSRLTSNLKGKCSFVYYSPYYFANENERQILNNCSQENLDWFYYSINVFSKSLRSSFQIYKESSPIDHINKLCKDYGYTKLIIDKPLFSMWQSINLDDLQIPYEYINSDLIQVDCRFKTAKHRWMDHVKRLDDKKYKWNSEIEPIELKPSGKSYPQINYEQFGNTVQEILTNGSRIRATYGQTRDNHNGQTRLSTLLQNGLIDPHNIFYVYANAFYNEGADLSKNEGNVAAMLRQFTFRELTLMKVDATGLTMESSVTEWSEKLLNEKSLSNLHMQENLQSTLTFDKIKTANTGIPRLDKVLKHTIDKGVMPNRARMWFAGKLFYEAPTGQLALEWCIKFFNEVTVDGQCPTNYAQCCDCMNLQYGRVMLLNEDRVMSLLNY